MKKIVKATLLAAALTALLCVCAMAETVTGSGFYGIGSASGVTITPQDKDGNAVASQVADVDDSKTGDETVYPGSVKLEVTLAGEFAAGENYVVFLMEGTAAPTKSDAIYYINQTTVTSETSITFDVYPMDIGGKKDLTLYITSDKSGFTTIQIPVSYHVPYTLGDVNADGGYNSIDALMALQIAAELVEPTGNQKLAADVTGDGLVNSIDALKILQYAAGLITSWS